MYRKPPFAPESSFPAARRGAIAARFCKTCGEVYPLHRSRHTGRPMYGKDHIAAPCAHEGELFTPGANWWEPAVDVLAEAAVQVAVAAPAPGTVS